MAHHRRELVLIAVLAFLSWGVTACAGGSDAGSGEVEESHEAEAGGDRATGEMASEPTESAEEHEEGVERREHEEGRESPEPNEHQESGAEEHADGEHDEGGEGEESGVYVDREATWDATRRGARLILSFDSGTSAFTGSVRNTTNEILCAVRVEVHLSGGRELGPTPRRDVAPGESIELSLATEGAGFEQWTAHPEISRCEG